MLEMPQCSCSTANVVVSTFSLRESNIKVQIELTPQNQTFIKCLDILNR